MLLYNIESIAKKLQSDSEVLSHIEHMATRGAGREDKLRLYIKDLLPQKFSVGNGIITDVNGTQSKQQDFFVYDAFNSPVFLKYETSIVIPVESVYATVEIKSTLNKNTLSQSINNIKSVKELKISALINSPFIPNYHNQIFGSIFAYTSENKIETIASNLQELCKSVPKSNQPSIICILDQGNIINVDKNGLKQICTMPSEQTTWCITKNKEEINLYVFYLLLQQHLNTTKNFPPDLLAYANNSHALDGLQLVVPKEILPDDASISLGDATLTGEELKFMDEYKDIFFKVSTNQLTAEDVIAKGISADELVPICKRYTDLINKTLFPT